MTSPLINYSSYVTGKRVKVSVDLMDTGSADYTFVSDSTLTESDYALLHEEASSQTKKALSSKILLG